MDSNICRFLPNTKEADGINILNFVYETKKRICGTMNVESVYKMHIVVGGTGKLHTLCDVYDLKCGDVFFTYPAMSYAIETINDFEYMYISYLGVRTNQLMDKLNISGNRFLFEGLHELIPIWKSSIIDNKSILNLRCEAVLLYTFSVLGEQINKNNDENDNITLKIKEYIDEHFFENSLSIEQISNKYSYNKKYISGMFKKNFGVGISQYINILRIQHACALMEQGFTSVGDIAFRSGFSEPLYFSKVFKKTMGISPKEHIHNLKNAQL